LFLCFSGFVSVAQSVNPDSVLARRQVPVLCYHQVRDWRPGDRQTDKDYIIPLATFGAQIKMRSDSGYHAILLDELFDYLVSGKALPP